MAELTASSSHLSLAVDEHFAHSKLHFKTKFSWKEIIQHGAGRFFSDFSSCKTNEDGFFSENAKVRSACMTLFSKVTYPKHLILANTLCIIYGGCR